MKKAQDDASAKAAAEARKIHPEKLKRLKDELAGDPTAAAELLQYLVRQASVPEFQVRWRWTPNSVAIWDNRSTQHYAVQDYWPAVRKMERAGICGDRPF